METLLWLKNSYVGVVKIYHIIMYIVLQIQRVLFFQMDCKKLMLLQIKGSDTQSDNSCRGLLGSLVIIRILRIDSKAQST